MTLKRKNIAITVLTATLMASGIITTANAAVYNASSDTVIVQKNHTVNSDTKTEKTSATGSNGYITFNSRIPATDTVIVYIKNSKNNIVSTDRGRFSGVSAGTMKTLQYLSGKGSKGNKFYPSFSLDNGSQSSSLSISYTFEP